MAALNEIETVCLLSCRQDLTIGGLKVAISDVLLDGFVK
jgi:hypothetical protein